MARRRIVNFIIFSSIVAVNASCDSELVSGSLKVKVDGSDHEYFVIDPNKGYAGQVTVKEKTVTLGHGPRIYLGDKCDSSMNNNMFWHPNLKKYTMSFTVDISGLGCGCNGALYLVNMPASSKTSCGDYYCDANYVCGEGCDEIDILEANNEACRVTAHKCDSTGCDAWGCGFQVANFGPSKKINTMKKFKMIVNFNEDSIITTIKQNDYEVVITQDDDTCGSGYIQTLSEKYDHMVLTASSWGDSGESMSWLDGDSCDPSVNCNHGDWSFSDIEFDSHGQSKQDNFWDKTVLWFQRDHPAWVWFVFSCSLLGTVFTLIACFMRCVFLWRRSRQGLKPPPQRVTRNERKEPKERTRRPMFSRREQNKNFSRNPQPQVRDPLTEHLLNEE